MKQKSMFLNLKNILHRDATDGCSAVISPKAPSEPYKKERERMCGDNRYSGRFLKRPYGF